MSSHNEDESQKVFEDLCSTGSTAEISYQLTGLLVFNVCLAFTATLCIQHSDLVAIKKVSSLHPLSKLLFLNLTATDLCVGVIAHPLYIVYLILLRKTGIFAAMQWISISQWTRYWALCLHPA